MRQNECYTVVNSKPVQNVVFQLFSIRPINNQNIFIRETVLSTLTRLNMLNECYSVINFKHVPSFVLQLFRLGLQKNHDIF